MPMSGVSGQWNMSLNIGGEDFFPADPTTVAEVKWFENVHQALPSLNLTIKDTSGKFSSVAGAGDGVPIDITLGDGDYSGESSARFNIQGAPQITHGHGYDLIKINAILDNLPYMRQVAQGLFKGSSSDVLSQLAGQVGLKFDGHTTSDAMTWLPNNRSLYGFATHIARHGWIDAGACMVLAVGSDKSLIYKNIFNPDSSGEMFSDGHDGTVQIVDWSSTSLGIIANNNRGYGSTSIGYTPEGILQSFDKVTFKMLSSFLGVSSLNAGAIGAIGGRVDSIIRSAGNTHENYDQALHQNQRMRATFSGDLNIITAQVTKSKLLDKVNAVPIDFTTNAPNPNLVGDYLLTSRTRSIIRSKYVERTTITGQS